MTTSKTFEVVLQALLERPKKLQMPFPKSSLSGMYDPDRAQGEKIYYGLDNEFLKWSDTT